MTTPSRLSITPLPERLEGLAELAFDLRWSWNHAADSLWEHIDADLWNRTGNPWLLLQTVPRSRINALAADADFRSLIDAYVTEYRQAMGAPAWFSVAYPRSLLTVAYFSMEYGLGEALPIYSGGLGVLAGDYLKAASDVGLPLVGFGLLKFGKCKRPKLKIYFPVHNKSLREEFHHQLYLTFDLLDGSPLRISSIIGH